MSPAHDYAGVVCKIGVGRMGCLILACMKATIGCEQEIECLRPSVAIDENGIDFVPKSYWYRWIQHYRLAAVLGTHNREVICKSSVEGPKNP